MAHYVRRAVRALAALFDRQCSGIADEQLRITVMKAAYCGLY